MDGYNCRAMEAIATRKRLDALSSIRTITEYLNMLTDQPKAKCLSALPIKLLNVLSP